MSESVQWFIRVVDPKGKVFIGIGALQYMLTDLEKRVAEDDSPITHLHVDHVGRYKHLLSAGERNLLGKLKDKLADRQARMSAVAMPAKKKKKKKIAHGGPSSSSCAAAEPTKHLSRMFD